MKKCPDCGMELKPVKSGGADFDECEKCKGAWYEGGEFTENKDNADPDLNWMDFEIWKHEDQFRSADSPRACPVCGENMVTVEYGHTNVIVDCCRSCKGMWLDRNEFNRIVSSLEEEVVSKSFSDYVREAVKEGAEIITGKESFLSEWRDFTTVVRLMQYRLFVEKPAVLNAITGIQRSLK